MGKRRANRRVNIRAKTPATATQVAGNLRRAIRQHVKTLTNRINANKRGQTAAAITAEFGADAAALAGYLAAGTALGTPPAPAAPAPAATPAPATTAAPAPAAAAPVTATTTPAAPTA
jgi:hypothetical protein